MKPKTIYQSKSDQNCISKFINLCRSNKINAAAIAIGLPLIALTTLIDIGSENKKESKRETDRTERRAELQAKKDAYPSAEYREFVQGYLGDTVSGYFSDLDNNNIYALAKSSCRVEAEIRVDGVRLASGQAIRPSEVTPTMRDQAMANGVFRIKNIDLYSTPTERIAIARAVSDANKEFGCP